MNQPPYIPDNAPFTEEQRSWLNGYLAGLFSEAPAGQAPASAPATPVTILYGSQTGTAETLCKKTAKQLKAANCDPKVVDMGDFSVEELQSVENLLLITSTYGEGDPPDNAQALHSALMAETAPRLEAMKFSVLGLGDSSYPDFCQCSKEFNARLEALGAKSIAPMVEVDGDPDKDFPLWLDSVQSAFGQAATAGDPIATVEEEDAGVGTYDRKNPFPAKIMKSRNLNKEGSSKETFHVEISLEGSGIDYHVGDALGVYPENNARLIDEILGAAGFAPDEAAPLPRGEDTTVFDALRYHYDISVLTEPFILACGRLSKNNRLQEIIEDPERRKAYIAGRGLVDPIVDFQVVFPTTEYLVAPLRQLNPRLYSISSSPKAHSGEVHLTVGRVSYDLHGRERLGVCSTFLAGLEPGRAVKVYPHGNKNFHLTADDDAPVIMIGPGTGIAPFRAFLEEREARSAKGKNWLFFGDQHAATDFLYEEQIERWMKSGLLSRFDTAFSRDEEKKVYVQHRMQEQADELYQWLEAGAYIYVCGDASRMAKDVDIALHQVVESVASIPAEEAAAYVEALKKDKRYLRDVY
jgi:sulfite reductase (NADPH) flavoprotein alpha-component